MGLTTGDKISNKRGTATCPGINRESINWNKRGTATAAAA